MYMYIYHSLTVMHELYIAYLVKLATCKMCTGSVLHRCGGGVVRLYDRFTLTKEN